VYWGVSPCLRRVRILEEAGIIQQYTALIDAEKVGKSLTLLRVFG
jgi:DNA-binding Lrp family transcriptional regulator